MLGLRVRLSFELALVLAALAMLFVDNLLGDPALFAAGISLDKLQVELREQIVVTRILANGFIVTPAGGADLAAGATVLTLAWPDPDHR